MTLSLSDIKKIAKLAMLDTAANTPSSLNDEINAIMNFVEQLRSVDTQAVAPLFHPLALQQRLREDAVTEEDCLKELEALAPLFDDNLYLVPKVLESK